MWKGYWGQSFDGLGWNSKKEGQDQAPLSSRGSSWPEPQPSVWRGLQGAQQTSPYKKSLAHPGRGLGVMCVWLHRPSAHLTQGEECT
jgi:hypothetical protein